MFDDEICGAIIKSISKNRALLQLSLAHNQAGSLFSQIMS